MLKKTLQISFKSLLILILLGIGYLNYALYYKPHFEQINGNSYNKSVYHQLNFLKTALRNGAGAEMQDFYPEGFVFINALYGSSWSNLIQNLDTTTAIYQEGIEEINWAIQALHSPKGKEVFMKDMPLEYGAFYKGWSNFLIGSQLAVARTKDSSLVHLFKANCQQIATALNQSKTPYLESYPDLTWPADIIVAVASLSCHDKIFEPLYQTTIKNWLTKVKKQLDPKTGLIPHAVAIDGTTITGARGSSQSLMLNFLKEIAPNFSKQQFEIYKKIFLDSRFGLPGIREYPKGSKGKYDVDSGPIILNIGGAASIVGQRTMGKYESWSAYEGLRNSIQGFGAAYTINSKKKYIFGQLPMADAFIAWSNSLETKKGQVKVNSYWRIRFQLLSLVIFLLFGYLIKKW